MPAGTVTGRPAPSRLRAYDRLLDGVDPRDLTAAEIYPPGWEEPGALDWAGDWFTGLTAYFEAAARDGHAVVVWLD
ncbi:MULTISPECIES: DUF1877 family protein [unclassified Streptomyces]|uniref:DUF1877 family protein n=1 Tax=unclassified Streptomyces TaxID=2593676 RepID=UPI0013012A71|nr:DUF1877 family protein [Streptomyces sp. CB01580]